jgi:hypothetical protein
MRLVYYSREHAYIVPHLARSFQNSFAFHQQLFNYTPSEDVLLFLQDFDDYGYAGATCLPRNYVILGIEPYENVYETSPTNERFNWVNTHELTHIAATDRAAPADRFFRTLFSGKVFPVAEDPLSMLFTYSTTPRKYSPRWYHEGIAVFMETWMSGGIGRVINGYDEMVFRTMVRSQSKFYDFVGLESEGTTIDFQIGANSYLYGTRFVTYLGREFGPHKVIEWFTRSDTSSAYFAANFERVFGKNIDEEWSRWIDFEHAWQSANLDSIRRYPLTTDRPLCEAPLGAVSKPAYDPTDNLLLVGVNAPGETAHIVALDVTRGTMRSLADVPMPSVYNVTSTAYDDSARRLFFTTKNTKGWRDICALDIRSGEVTTLLKDARIGDLTFSRSDRSLWGIQHHQGISRLVRIPHPYDHWEEMFQLKYGLDLYDPDISPDGKTLVAAMMEINGRHRLVAIPMSAFQTHEITYEVLYEFENTAPLNFVFSRDGHFLFGSTFHTGVSNVVRYDMLNKRMEWLTNAETGVFRPLPLSADSTIAFRYTAKGFLPVMIANRTCDDVSAISYLGHSLFERHPELAKWKLPPPSPLQINIDSLTISSGMYDGFSHLNLGSIYPVVHGYKSSVAVGLRSNFFDPLLLHDLVFSLSYSPSQSLPIEERFHAMMNYEYLQWKARASYNFADFYDLFGPTKRARKGYTVSVRYSDAILNDRPTTLEYSLAAAAYWGLERLPYAQNIAVTYDNFFTFGGDLSYTRLLRSLGAVDYEKGTTLSINNYTYVVRDVWFPLFYGSADFGFALPWGHSSVWLRTSAGYSPKDEEEPFSNFYFGGFGNNWVDFREVRRYRDVLSFPGVRLNEIGGTTFAKSLVEWTLPPLRFRRLGVAGLYCTWSRLALFGGSIVTNLQNAQLQRVVSTVGAQMDFKLVVFSNMSTTLSLGYALAFENNERTSKEFMVSLKIL